MRKKEHDLQEMKDEMKILQRSVVCPTTEPTQNADGVTPFNSQLDY